MSKFKVIQADFSGTMIRYITIKDQLSEDKALALLDLYKAQYPDLNFKVRSDDVLRSVSHIEMDMDYLMSWYFEQNLSNDVYGVTVAISKQDYDLLRDYFINRHGVKPGTNLVGYKTLNNPWGFKIKYDDKLVQPEMVVLETP